MRITFIILLAVASFGISAQIKTIPLRSMERFQIEQDSTSAADSVVLQLPFWDDFSTSSGTPSSLLWNSVAAYNVYVNDALSIHPPTYNVATLDGLRGSGIAHNIGADFNGIADSLVSHKIDLSGYDVSDSLYISFFWQAGGHGDMPDEDDSLSLHLLATDTAGAEWVSVWSEGGGDNAPDSIFRQVIKLLDHEKYFHKGFRFKFQSFARLSGPFDIFHIDYVYLNHSRTRNDTSFSDRALAGKPGNLFAPYYEIPAHAFFSNPSAFITQQSVEAVNLQDAASGVTFHYELKNLTTGDTYHSSQITAGVPSSLASYETIKVTSPSDISIGAQTNPLDSQVLQSKFYMSTTDTLWNLHDINFKANDTLSQQYLLEDHYAYDDGIAEYAAGINVKQGKLAVRYVLAEPDTLTHIDIHFPSIEPAAEGQTINVTVWTSLDVERAIATQPYTIELNNAINEFKRIKLARSKLVGDTIYIGYQQLIEEYIGIGFDRSNQEASDNIFYKTGDSWVQNDRLKGIFMIRPVFASDSTFILGNRRTELSEIAVYPNPSQGQFQVSGDYNSLEVFDLSGTRVYASSPKSSHFLDRPSGIYLLRLQTKEGLITKKLLID